MAWDLLRVEDIVVMLWSSAFSTLLDFFSVRTATRQFHSMLFF